MKNIIIFVLCAVMILFTNGCGSRIIEKDNDVSSADSAQIPNPFVECETLEKAEQLAGFEISLPEKMPDGFTQSSILAIKNDMIEIIFNNKDDEIRIRKAEGKKDISGDYNEYKDKNTIKVDNLTVTTKGNDDKINVATWNDGNYSYSISANVDEKGIGNVNIIEMIKNIK